ncbi:MAG: plasmid pRiA4b ORF-3 family protein [Verrucomicrobiales bacterium]|nr:plasmid pRiA4b ORF-3 family protein [Verrucomicrobiales bacterium]
MIDLNEFDERGDVALPGESCLLRVGLDGIDPSIDRLLIAPRMANLGWVHAVIQVAMEWTNSHLHQFRIGDVRIFDPRFNLDEYEGDPPVLDDAKVTLEEVLAGKGPELIYEYDFGDSWNRVLTFMKPRPPQAGIKHWAVPGLSSRGLRQHPQL